MKHDTRRGKFSSRSRRLLLLLCVTGLGLTGALGRGVPAAFAQAPTILFVGNAIGPYGGTATVTANLSSGGIPITGESVDLHIGATDLGPVVTDVNGDATIPAASLAGINVGTYTSDVTASFAGDVNFDPSNGANDLTVNPAPLTITADDQSKVYGAALPTLTASITGFQNGETLATSDVTGSPSLSTTATAGSPVAGSPYSITAAQGSLSSGNYSFSFVDGSLTVTPAPLTITADNQTTVYGAALPTLTASYSGFVNGDTAASLTTAPTLTTSATAASHVAGNPYIITASGAVDPNYTISYVPGSLTITTAPLAIMVDDQSKGYGDPVPTLTASYSGFVNGDTSASLNTLPTLSTAATANSPVAGSPYAITAAGAVASDYSISYVPGTLTITTAPLTITADDQSKVYGDPLPTLTASISGFQNGETLATSDVVGSPSLSTTATAGSPVADSPYLITAAQGSLSSGNYSFSFVNGNLSITPAPLTITADDQTTTYGAALPTLTASYSGFVNGDTAASLTAQPTLTTTATIGSIPGDYPITASGALDPDYAISYVAGTLTVGSPPVTNPPSVRKITPVITWATPAPITFGTALGDAQLNATAPVAGTFTYSSPAGSVLGVGTTLLTVLFTPFDTVDYNAASALVYLTVQAAPPVTVPIVPAVATATPTTVPTTAPVAVSPATTPVATTTVTPTVPVTLIIHNKARTEIGGRTHACDLAKNTNGAKQRGCEIVSSVSAPGATVTYTLTYADGSSQHFTDTADRRGHSLHPFNVAYRPTARSVARITVQATLPGGTMLGPVKVRFAVMR
jgi:hypothetical protein